MKTTDPSSSHALLTKIPAPKLAAESLIRSGAPPPRGTL